MDTDNPNSGLELRTKARSAGELELSLVDVPIRELATDEVLVRPWKATPQHLQISDCFSARPACRLRAPPERPSARF